MYNCNKKCNMKKILWFVFLLTTVVFSSCTIEDDNQLLGRRR